MKEHIHGVPRAIIRGTRCTVERHNGQFCDAPSAEGMPFPICARHAIKLYRYLASMVDSTDRTVLAWETMRKLQAQQALAQRQAKYIKHTVYYVKVGELIKIGYTSNMRLRMRDYPPNRWVMAVEDGDGQLERQRHNQFAALRTHGQEWYRPGRELVAHINELRRRHGRPAVTELDIRPRGVNAVT